MTNMPMSVALLRAVYVAGHNKVAMADLRELFTTLGFKGATSLLQSGNLVFHGDRRQGESLEKLLEDETDKRLGLAVDYVVRTDNELKKVIAANPFSVEAKRDPGHLVVMFLKSQPRAKDVQSLQSAIRGSEVVRSSGKQLYIVYPDGIGRSKLTSNLIEKTIGSRGTVRNWNTVLKLDALMQRDPAAG